MTRTEELLKFKMEQKFVEKLLTEEGFQFDLTINPNGNEMKAYRDYIGKSVNLILTMECKITYSPSQKKFYLWTNMPWMNYIEVINEVEWTLEKVELENGIIDHFMESYCKQSNIGLEAAYALAIPDYKTIIISYAKSSVAQFECNLEFENIKSIVNYNWKEDYN